MELGKSELISSNDLVSVIVPTYNEKDSIAKLIQRIEDVAQNGTKQTEVIFVDDNSPDGTGAIIESLAQNTRNNMELKLVSRKEKGGLSSAVVNGLKIAQGRACIVMDADLSHPPEIIPDIVMALDDGYDLVIASRYMPNGKVEGWTFLRKNISKIATWMTNKKFKLTVTDPMSGFFGVNKDSIADVDFHGIGYKLLLEILVKRKKLAVKEIPYTFTNRNEGKSKLGIKDILDHLRLMRKLAQ